MRISTLQFPGGTLLVFEDPVRVERAQFYWSNWTPNVTDEQLDEYAGKLVGRLDAILASLPADHPDHFASAENLPKKGRYIGAKDRPFLELEDEDG